MREAKTILWKELKDLSRDYRTHIAVVVLPLIGLPGLAIATGLLASTQQVTVALVIEDRELWSYREDLSKIIIDSINLYGIKANLTIYNTLDSAKNIVHDILVYIPNGFLNNVTKIDGRGRIIISVLIGSQASDLARQAVESAFHNLANSIVKDRVKKLGEEAGVTINPDGLLNPIIIERGFHKVTGAPATSSEASVAEAAKVLEFSLFFVVNPTVVFMSDSIIGEKERKTIEKLLMAPVSRRQLLTGKLLASGILGLLSAMADGVGIIIFFSISGMSFTLSPFIIVVWLLATLLLVLSTAPLIAVISSRSESIRAAQNASFIVVMIALAIYFSSLAVDISKLPQYLSTILSLLPFIHAALMIHNYALGEYYRMAFNILALILFWVILTILAARSFNTEKLILTKT